MLVTEGEPLSAEILRPEVSFLWAGVLPGGSGPGSGSWHWILSRQRETPELSIKWHPVSGLAVRFVGLSLAHPQLCRDPLGRASGTLEP